MLADTTRRKFFELCPPSWIKTFIKSENKVYLKNGSEIIFRSLDSPERLTNLELDWFGLDEIGEVELETFEMLQGRLRKPGGSHRGFGVGNPAGPTHWTYEYFVLKAETMPEEYHLTHATSYANTFLSTDYTERMEKSFGTDSLYFKRYVLGQFVAFEGAYWPDFDVRYYPDGHVIRVEQIAEILTPPLYFGKVLDFGYEHPFCLLWYIHDRKKIIFFDEYHKRHETILNHCKAIKKKEKEHQTLLGVHLTNSAWTDHDAQCRAEIENCKDESDKFIGFTCVPAEKKVMESILSIQSLIVQRRLFISDRCVRSRIEIPSYRAKPIDKSTKEQPIKHQDDTCDCIRMAGWEEFKHELDFIRQRDEFVRVREETQDSEDKFFGSSSILS